MADRYFLTVEIEVSKEHYVSTERECGFYSQRGRHEPATAAFSYNQGGKRIEGRVEHARSEVT